MYFYNFMWNYTFLLNIYFYNFLLKYFILLK